MSLPMSWRDERGKGEAFPARIGRKPGFAIGLALFMVLLAGGISIYLSSSLSRGTQVIETESEEIEHVNRLHTMMNHAIEEDRRSTSCGA